MEGVVRKPFQGVLNIVRFNWHFYVLAGVSVLILLLASSLLSGPIFWTCMMLSTGIVASTFISLCVSHYVYDRSGIYDFAWLRQFNTLGEGSILNIHAGFDETSGILRRRFPDANFDVFDFYDPALHTEVSIERARKVYAAYEPTIKITTARLPINDGTIDIIFNIFALHEIRDRNERIQFLKEQVRALRKGGQIILVEHLRDLPNFLAYNVGFLHFLSTREWRQNFQQAGLDVHLMFKTTPFVTVYMLKKADGNTR